MRSTFTLFPDITFPDVTEINEDIASMEDVYRKLAAEIEALNIELEAPPRIRPLDDAVADRR